MKKISQKNKRVGNKLIAVRLSKDMLKAVDFWKFRLGAKSRPDAIRQMIDLYMYRADA